MSLRRAAPSIRGRLLAWLLGAVLGAGLLAGAVVYAVVLHEIDELFDYHIRQHALSLAAQSIQQDGVLLALPDKGHHEELDFAVQIWNEQGDSVYFSPNYPALPARAVLGFSEVNDSRGEWRVYATQWRSHTIQVVQPLSVRREMALQSALRALVPLFLIVPLLAAAVWVTVGRAMRPLRGVVDAVERKGASALEPLEETALPVEIAPLVAALNRLLRRLERSIGAQRAFIGDAAHELRTPLAALRLQAQVLVRQTDAGERRAASDEFVASIDRATHLVEQLLELARSEPDAAAHAFAPLRLDELARETVAELAGAALAKGIDLGLGRDQADGVTIRGEAQSLRILLRNLVDNAVRYTPAGGRVDVIAARRDGRAVLSVADTGPGIAPAERDRVFDRFYRPPGSAEGGSGLGLAIVRRIADLHGAQVRLEAGEGGIGLKATVEFARRA